MGSTDAVLILKGLIKSRLKIEYAFYHLLEELETFSNIWGVNQCICGIDDDGSLKIYV